MSNIKSYINLVSVMFLTTSPLLITSLGLSDLFVIFIGLFLSRIIGLVLPQVLATCLLNSRISRLFIVDFSIELILATLLIKSGSILVFILGDNVLI